MLVVGVLSQKGGAGKTTIATNLARAWQLRGSSTVLVDSDPQGSARDWAAVREDNPVMTVGIDRPTLERDVRRLPGADIVVIDGTPRVADMAVSAVKASDFVLIPVQPSPYDIWAASDLAELVLQRIAMTDGKTRAAFVISRAIKGTVMSREIAAALAEYELPVLTTVIYQRQDYPRTAARGLSVFDDPAATAAVEELDELATEIDSVMKEGTQ